MQAAQEQLGLRTRAARLAIQREQRVLLAQQQRQLEQEQGREQGPGARSKKALRWGGSGGGEGARRYEWRGTAG